MKKNEEKCEIFCVNPEAVNEVKENLLAHDEVSDMAETFKVLGDRTRINILRALTQRELCVCDLSTVLDMSPSAVSHQLRVLRNARLVKNRKEGKNVYYSIDDNHVITLFEQVLEHVCHG